MYIYVDVHSPSYLPQTVPPFLRLGQAAHAPRPTGAPPAAASWGVTSPPSVLRAGPAGCSPTRPAGDRGGGHSSGGNDRGGWVHVGVLPRHRNRTSEYWSWDQPRIGAEGGEKHGERDGRGVPHIGGCWFLREHPFSTAALVSFRSPLFPWGMSHVMGISGTYRQRQSDSRRLGKC